MASPQRQNPRYPRPEPCRGCALDQIGFGYALPSGPVGAALTFVGESLGYEEAIAGEGFYGAAGGVLSRLCQRAGIDRRQVRIANTVSCRPPGDFLVGAPWEEAAIAHCRRYLQPVLDSVPDGGVVVPLGATALDAVLNLRGVDGVRVQDFHGYVERSVDDRYWVVPSYHPSHLQRGAMNLLEAVTQDLAKAQRIASHGFTRSQFELVVDPHPEWFAHWVDQHLRRVTHDVDGVHLAIDTEFAEKSGGADESEVVLADTASPITRINGANDGTTGWTVPYREPFITIARRLIEGVSRLRGWIWMWAKYADLDHLWRAGFDIANDTVIDGMWLWHYLQSDLPRGLGFVAPMASDFHAWKHWAKDREREGPYAAADGLQTWRTCMWLLAAAHRQGVWDLYMTDWHERDAYVLRPASAVGVPVNRPALVQFHEELQRKLGEILQRIKTTAAQGVLKPKHGYAKKPKGKPCLSCDGDGDAPVTVENATGNCPVCGGGGTILTPPASILGKPKKGGGEAKQQYMLEGVRLVEREITVPTRVCRVCGTEAVGPKHRCRRTPRSRKSRSDDTTPTQAVPRPDPELVVESRTVRRYFWQLPFNPDAPAQVLAYLAQQGIEAPIDRKRGTATTNKKAMSALRAAHPDDPFFSLELDWKAVQKVDATYAVGSLNRLDADDRLHPNYTCKPSTFRDACENPNLQNVVADKAGPDGLASGFRRTIQARDGIPPGTTDEQLATWESRWP